MMQTPQASTPQPVREDAKILFDERRADRLAEIFAPCFALVLQLRATDAYGEASILRERILDMLNKTKRDAQQSGISAEAAAQAEFALVAFFDETILSSDWPRKDHWLAKPLQLELYDRYDAGEEFFVRLEQFRAEGAARAELVEVFYLCMALGFKGRYLLHEQEKLRALIEQTHAELSRLPGMQVGALSPHGVPSDQVAAEVKTKLPPWVIAVAAFVIGLLIYLGMSLYISNAASEAADEMEAIALVLPSPSDLL